LANYTVLTNLTVEGTNQVSIGLHYPTNDILPTFMVQPSSQTVIVGMTATFNAIATGIPLPSYQWRKNGANISGATSSAYTISNAQSTDAASYSVVAANVAGSATSSTATLTVIVPPTITTQPTSQTVNQGQTASFSVAASGT